MRMRHGRSCVKLCCSQLHNRVSSSAFCSTSSSAVVSNQVRGRRRYSRALCHRRLRVIVCEATNTSSAGYHGGYAGENNNDDDIGDNEDEERVRTSSDETQLAKRVLRFVLPSLATVLSAPLLSLTDTAFVGRCAPDAAASSFALAALSQATILCDYVPLISTFVSTAALNITADLLARGDEDGAIAATATALLLATVIGMCIAAIIFVYPKQILALQGVEADVLEKAVEYSRWRALGTPFASCTAAACAALAARKDTLLPFIGVLVGGIVNVVLDWLAVARGGWGVGGAAAATAAAQVVSALIVIGSAAKRKYIGKRVVLEHARSIMRFCAPVIFVTTSVLSIFSSLIIVAQQMGVITSAAHRVLGSLFGITSLAGDPLMQAVQTFLPASLLEKDDRGTQKLLMLCLSIGAVFSAVGGLCVFCIAYFVPSLFTTNSSCIAMIRSVLPCFSLAIALVVPSKVLYGAALAANDLKFLTYLIVIGTIVVFGQLLYLIRAGLGYGALWLVLSSYYFVAIVALTARLSTKIRGNEATDRQPQ